MCPLLLPRYNRTVRIVTDVVVIYKDESSLSGSERVAVSQVMNKTRFAGLDRPRAFESCPAGTHPGATSNPGTADGRREHHRHADSGREPKPAVPRIGRPTPTTSLKAQHRSGYQRSIAGQVPGPVHFPLHCSAPHPQDETSPSSGSSVRCVPQKIAAPRDLSITGSRGGKERSYGRVSATSEPARPMPGPATCTMMYCFPLCM